MKRLWYVSVLVWAVAASANAQTQISGLTEFARIVEIHAPVPGVVAEVAVGEGETIVAGDLLVQLEDSLQVSRLAIAEAAVAAQGGVERARAQLAHAQSRLTRVTRAVKRGGGSRWEIDEAKFAVNTAQADVKSAEEQILANKARLDLETAALAQMRITAPFSGTVVEVFADNGHLASSSDPLLVMVGSGQMEIVGFVPATLMADLSVGDRVSADLAAPVSTRVDAIVKAIDPRIEPGSGSVRIVFEFSNAGINSPSGVEATVQIGGS
ncbi:MAG: efflux RND transporter periplasmic adaptor subunit [Pseudomonadota bacterium]